MSNKATEPQTAKIDSKAVFAALDKVMAESLSTTKQEPGEPSRPAAKAEPEVRPSAPTSEEPLTPETAGSRPILRVVNAKLPPDAFVPENPATAQSAPVVAEPQQPDLTPFIAEDEPFQRRSRMRAERNVRCGLRLQSYS